MSGNQITIQSLPQEIIEQTLLKLDETDILAYCASHKDAYHIWDSDTFWLNKLDYDFTKKSKSENKACSSFYAIKYEPEENRHLTYQRWKRFFTPIAYTDNVVDIMNFIINQFIFFGEYRSHIMIADAIKTNNLKLLNYITNYNMLPPVPDIIDGIIVALEEVDEGDIQIATLEWLRVHGALPNQEAADNFAFFGKLHILKWLQRYNIFPSRNGADLCILKGFVDVLQWCISLGIFPTQTGADYAAKNDNIYILQLLEAQGILPSKQGFISALVKYNHNTVLWLIKRGIRILPNDINEIKTQLKEENDFNHDGVLYLVHNELYKDGGYE